jgi:hypothetical protein
VGGDARYADGSTSEEAQRTMDLRHFFENMVRREETASAFLATLLDFDPEFRAAFLAEATGDPSFDGRGPWRVTVEEARVDVTLDSDAVRVLIEDKIAAGARQEGQLLRYYLRAVEEVPEKRLVALYLAPHDMGRAEVERVARHSRFIKRATDITAHVSWSDIVRIIGGLPDSPNGWFARTGMREVERAIQQAASAQYPAIGDRAVVRDLVGRACDALVESHPTIRPGRWHGGDTEEITYGGPVTLWLDTMFAFDPVPPHLPVGVVQADGVHIVIRSAFKLAAKSRSDPRLRSAWDGLRAEGRVDVPSVGVHVLRPNGWFVFEAPIVGSEDDVASEIVHVGSAVLQFLRASFGASEGMAGR